jgi:transposase
MTKIAIKEYTQGQTTLFPQSLDERIAEDAPVRVVNYVVDRLDLTEVMATYKGGGCSCYSPRMLLKVLFFAYMNNVYSCRRIEKLMDENIQYMWLSGDQHPDFHTVNTFRSKHLKDTIDNLFSQVVMLLVEEGYISLREQYVDGTKIESKSNKYRFVWRGTVEKSKAKLEKKIKAVLADIEKGIADDEAAEESASAPMDSKRLKERIDELNKTKREERSKEERKMLKELEEKMLPKMQEYEESLSIMGDRNSYSKTDHDATFMRMKEDAMCNGQLKPGYNLQIGTENQFVTNYALYPNPNDTLTLPSFLDHGRELTGTHPESCTADAGYGSEANYDYLEACGILPYVKYNYFHKEQKRAFSDDPYRQENLHYNEEEDYLVCPSGQHMHRVGEHLATDPSGNRHTITTYRASHCDTCPLHPRCFKGKGDREVEVNHNLRRHKAYARELLTSEEGLLRRSRRPIEPEAVFGQMKYDKQYKRFRHFGKAKVHMDLGLFFIAFNLQKMIRGGLRTIITDLKWLHESLFERLCRLFCICTTTYSKSFTVTIATS